MLDASLHATKALEDLTDRMLLWGKAAQHKVLLRDGSMLDINELNSAQCKAFLDQRGCRYGNRRQARTLRNEVRQCAERLRRAPSTRITSILLDAGQHIHPAYANS